MRFIFNQQNQFYLFAQHIAYAYKYCVRSFEQTNTNTNKHADIDGIAWSQEIEMNENDNAKINLWKSNRPEIFLRQNIHLIRLDFLSFVRIWHRKGDGEKLR